MRKIKIWQRKALVKPAGAQPKRSLRSKLILVLLSVIALGSLFLLVLPYLPHLYYLVRHPRIDATSYKQAAAQTKQGQTVKDEAPKIGNRLVLPDIGVDAQIIEGAQLWVIGKNQGVWRESRSVNPTKDGNMVIAGHRFLYTATNGGYFYNLPELKVGQKIYVKWDNKVYEYDIYNTRTVKPTEVNILLDDPNVPRKLTLYTCHPLGTTAKRFVVEAKQV